MKPSPRLRSGSRDAALLLFSGGQDSSTCLYWAQQKFARLEAIAFNYGQKHWVELDQAKFLAREADIPLSICDIRNTLHGSALTEHDKDVSGQHEKDAALPASFLPGRNALFLTLAASHAYNRDIFDLVGGMCQTDYSGYPDCRRVFIDATETSLSLAMDCDLRIHTPLMYFTKAETWKLANELGVLEIIREHTHTDYNGDRTTRNEWGYGKLDNPASVLRAQGYEEAKAKGWV